VSGNWPEIDGSRSACLCDVGLPDYAAATAVSADGSTYLLLAYRTAINDAAVSYDRDCSEVRHEQLGRLPEYMWRRIWGPHLCGRPNRKGRPCGIAVGKPDDACAWHCGRDRVPGQPI
jgi:hypothetical protein